jgi:hypothetical protein
MPGNKPLRPRIRKLDKSEEDIALPQEISDRLEHLSRLPQNWDGYGASPISPKVIKRVKSVLKEALAVAEGVPAPLIAPANDGTIVLEWKTSSGKELILDIPSDDEPVPFLLVEPKEPGGKAETEGVIGKPTTLVKIIQWLQTR